jgi:hypothetical protein
LPATVPILPEENFIITLLQDPAKALNECASLSHELDTGKLLKFLQWNRLIPYLYREIKDKQAEKLFSSIFLSKIALVYKQEVLKSMKREAVLKKTLSLLSNANINVTLLKGALFAYTYYSSPELRPSYDIDLLIDPDRIKKAQEILLEAGYEKWYEIESAHTMGQMPHLPGLKYMDIPVELHHHLFHGFEKETGSAPDIFTNTQKINLFGYNINVLLPEITLFYLLYHIHKHMQDGYSRFIWVFDIKLLLEKEERVDIDNTFRTLLKQSNKKNEIEEIIYFMELVTGSKFYNFIGNEKIISEFLSKCHSNRESEYIKTIHALKRLPSTKHKIKFILGRLFPSFIYVKFRYGVKNNIAVVLCYFRIYYEYLVKLIRVVGKRRFEV